MTNEDTKIMSPFEELPEALVEEMLNKCKDISTGIFDNFENIRKQKKILRNKLREKKLLYDVADFGTTRAPTTCGVDGSYDILQLVSTDIVAGAAIAIEGLTPPWETRYWYGPKHLVEIEPVDHSGDNNSIIRGITMGMEVQLASNAPHNIVFLDGSLTTPIIYLNQSLTKETDNILTKKLKESLYSILSGYKKILTSKRTDKIFVGVPKYTTRDEITKKLDIDGYEDKALLSLILKAGEFVGPIKLKPPDKPWHLKISDMNNKEEIEKIVDEIKSGLDELRAIYYRPNSWMPALRLEFSKSVADNRDRIVKLLEGIKYQCEAYAIMEPWPLYIADRMVKNLSKSLPALKENITYRISESYKGDMEDITIGLHNYRS